MGIPSSTPIDRAELKRLCAEATPELSALNARPPFSEAANRLWQKDIDYVAAVRPGKVLALIAELEAVERRYKAALNRLADCSRDLTAKDAEIERLKAAIADASERLRKSAEVSRAWSEAEHSAECCIDDLRTQLAAANARIAELEAELDQAIGVIEDRALPEIGPEELRPCPFCGSSAHRVNIPTVGSELGSDPNAGGSYIECTRCSASSAIHFNRKENLFSSWNDRARSALSEAPGGETAVTERMKDEAAHAISMDRPDCSFKSCNPDYCTCRIFAESALAAAFAPPAIKGKE